MEHPKVVVKADLMANMTVVQMVASRVLLMVEMMVDLKAVVMVDPTVDYSVDL